MAASAEAKSGCPDAAPLLPLSSAADAWVPEEPLAPDACCEDDAEASLRALPGSPSALGLSGLLGLDGAGIDALGGGCGMLGVDGEGIDGDGMEGVEGEGVEGVGIDGDGIDGEGVDGGDGGCGMLGSLGWGIEGDVELCCGCFGCGCVWFVWHACSISADETAMRQRYSA